MTAMSTEGPGDAKTSCRKLAVVIGAGVAGCQAARALLRAGYDALVLEQGCGVGGVWRRNYHSFALQVPWTCYTFPEFPYDKAPRELAERAVREVYPSGETVKDYIAAYCAHFDLECHMVYGAKVVHLAVLPGNRWSVRFRQAAFPGQSPSLGPLKTMEADVVVMATGMYYSPYVPSVPGLASFKGTVLHARDFSSVSALAGKRVLVLGGGKSATDCAVVAASPAARAASVTTLFRQAHWPLPRQLFGLPFHRVVYTRFTAAMLPMYYTGQDRVSKRLKHGLMSPLKKLFWGSVESHVARKMALRGHLRPELDFVEDMFFGGQIQDGSWNEAVNAGRIFAVQGTLAEIRPGGVRLTDGTVIDCDVLIFATGYTKDYNLFDAATAHRLMAAGGAPSCGPGTQAGLHLYRSVVCPWVANLYFIGCEAASFNNVLTSGLQSLWMVHHLLGALQLPGSQELMKDIQKQRTWRRSVMPSQHYCASTIMLFQQRYHDQLVRDLGHTPKRKRATRRGGSECFGLYTAEDYADLFADDAVPGMAAAAAAAPPTRPADAVVAAAVTLMPAAAAIGARVDLAVMPGGGGAAAETGGVQRAALMPVCTEHSDAVAVAVAVAPADDGGGGGGGSAAADVVAGHSGTFIRSFDIPAKLPVFRCATLGTMGPASAAATTATHHVVHGTTPAQSARPQRHPATLLEATAGGVTAAAEAVPDSCGGGSVAMEVLDTTADGDRTSPMQMGVLAVNTSSNALPSGSASVADSTAAAAAVAGIGVGVNGAVSSPFSTNTALSASMAVAGSGAAGWRTSSPRAQQRLTLVRRVRLQVLHLVNRSTSGGSATGGGGGGGNGAEEVLEFGVTSNTTQSERFAESMATTSRGHVYGIGGGGGAAVHGSSNLCYENMRHAVPNAYSELMGTLEVH